MNQTLDYSPNPYVLIFKQLMTGAMQIVSENVACLENAEKSF